MNVMFCRLRTAAEVSLEGIIERDESLVRTLTSALETVGLLMMMGLALAQLASASKCTSPMLRDVKHLHSRHYPVQDRGGDRVAN